MKSGKNKNREKPESVTMPHEKRLVGIVLGTWNIVTEDDKQLAKEIEEIKLKGLIVEIPSEIV